MIMLEGAKATTETVDALRTGAATMKAMQKATYVVFSLFMFGTSSDHFYYFKIEFYFAEILMMWTRQWMK